MNSSSTTRTRTPCRHRSLRPRLLLFVKSAASRCLCEGEFDATAHARGQVFMIHRRSRESFCYQLAAETGSRMRANRWAIALLPYNLEHAAIVPRIETPTQFDAALRHRKRAVFRRIGRQFVENQAEGRG